MATTTASYRWRWAFPILGLFTWLALGCSPQSLSMLLMPFGGNLVEPDYKLFAAKKEITLVILANFTHPDLRPEIETELADKVTQLFRSRCEENKHKVKFVPQPQVRSLVLKQLAEGELAPIEIGKHFKADYVLDLRIESCDLYQKKMHPPHYNGDAVISVNLYKNVEKEGWSKDFNKECHIEFPGE